MERGGDALEIDILDEIGGWGTSAKDFKAMLDEMDDGREIKLTINSPGGSVFDGIAIYNWLAERRDRVTVHVYGMAASIASVIAMAGRELTMHQGSMLMIHDPWSLTIGDAGDHRQTADLLDKIRDQIVDIYASRSTFSEDDIRDAMAIETWLDADEAAEAGFVTAVTGELVAAMTDFEMLKKFKDVPARVLSALVEGETKAAAAPQKEGEHMENMDALKDAQAAVAAEVGEVKGSVESISAGLESVKQEVAEMGEAFQNISIGRKTMPSDPKDAHRWFFDALMNINVKRGVPMDAAATISVGDGFGVPIPASEEFLINLNHYSIARRFGAKVRGAGAQQTKLTTSIVKNEAAIIAEHGTYAEKAEPTPITMDLFKVGGRYSISEETDEDSILDVYNTFQMEAAVAIAKGENHYFLDGAGTTEPDGLTTESNSVKTTSASAITFAELVELDESLGVEWDTELMWDGKDLSGYRGPVYVMHPTTAAAVRAVVSGESNFVFTEDGMGRLVKLFNRPVIRDAHMPEIAGDAKAIALVNFGAYVIGERRPNLSLRVGMDNDNHDITWDFAERVGGKVWDSNGVAILEMQ
jgi:HK97 family phage major capsid protein/ATP-dependent Clp endopeptidase proteolytic subunit ClpP